MTTLIAVAVGVPCLGVLAFLGMRRIQSLPFARSLALARAGDMRGIALQTVIIMVVLLAIAGAVAAVLFNRAQEATDDLEAQDVTAASIDTQAECVNYDMNGAPVVWDASAGTCTWTALNNGVSPPDVTQGRCLLVRGTYTPGTSSAKATCVAGA